MTVYFLSQEEDYSRLKNLYKQNFSEHFTHWKWNKQGFSFVYSGFPEWNRQIFIIFGTLIH